ncbi:hypothetical protein WBP07_11455 [Novosphingobium sp. BL-8A]|uniref:hypothetical protein n=1 Tax=Novosphingobium sp. BL-8A TaxID=3127639 RepID=UPI0037571419
MKGKFGSLFRFFSVLSLGFALTGCATVRGAQDRVPALVGSPDLIPVNTALQNFYMPLDSARLGMN